MSVVVGVEDPVVERPQQVVVAMVVAGVGLSVVGESKQSSTSAPVAGPEIQPEHISNTSQCSSSQQVGVGSGYQVNQEQSVVLVQAS